MKKAQRQVRRNQREVEKVRKAAPRKAKARTIKRGAKQVAKRETLAAATKVYELAKEVGQRMADRAFPIRGSAHQVPKQFVLTGTLVPVPGRRAYTANENSTRGGFTPPTGPANADVAFFSHVRQLPVLGRGSFTGGGYPVDPIIAQAWANAGSWATPASTFTRVARSFR